ncbi:TonB-dependent receptor [Novosphingobium rosa]|uniref:TonB-dependent receptor n=1 Tax=Novosphingobium rosa TaxID=76978 RepID=UPI00082C0EEE|nr:TonB-dependent receptor [Novosphingobium rosa]
MNWRATLLCCVSSAGGLVLTAPSMAQTTASVPDAAASRVPDGAEIVVTANKRSENISKVGLSITAISGDTLTNRKLTSMEDVASSVPGLAYAPSATNTPIFTLRGVGFNESSLGVYPAVSVYLDQTPLPFPVMASHVAYDLERLEVLKGPQGTLFGQNSTGGAINYIAAKPTSSLSAGGNISYGRFNQLDGNAYISGPLTERLGFRLAGTALRSDDWQYSYTRNDRLGKQRYVAGRLLLDWKPFDAAHLLLNVNGWRDTSDPQAQQLTLIFAQIPQYASPALLNYPFAPNNARAADWSTGVDRPRADRGFFQASLRGDVELGGGLTLTSLTSYDRYKQTQVTDGDGMSLLIFDLGQNDGHINSFNQEVRLANDQTSTLRWIVGGNYERSNTFERQVLLYRDGTNNNPANLFINASGVTNHQSIENYAAFGNLEWKPIDRLTLKGAARYTSTRNQSAICGYAAGDGNVATLFNALGGLLGTVPFTPITASDCYTLNANNVPGRVPVMQTLKQDNVSWRAGADFQMTPRMLLYANVSRGYKAGSFPSLAAAIQSALRPVTQESVTAYEAGIKTQLFDRKLSLNAAAFYYDYRDKQVRGKTLDPIFGTLDILINVPRSRIQGFEGDATLRPVKGLTLTGAVTYLDSKVLEYQGVNVLGQSDQFRGDPLPFTPQWSGSFNLDYRHELADGGAPFLGLGVTARSTSYAVLGGERISVPASATTIYKPGVQNVFQLDGYATVDGQIGYAAPHDRWRVTIWGKNLFNKYYWTNVNPGNDSAARFAGRPVTYGVTFAFKYR